MSREKRSLLWIAAGIAGLALTALVGVASAADDKKEEKFEQRYAAFAVAMGAGMAGVLEITVTRWSTDEERKALVDSLAQNGQEKTVDLLRKQKETGFARTQSGAGMQGWPSSRLHYAHESQKDGKRVVVLVTDRNMSVAEEMRQDRSVDYDVSAIVMELEPVTGDKKLIEKGQGTYYAAVKLSFDKDNKLKVEYLGTQPVRLTDIRREKSGRRHRHESKNSVRVGNVRFRRRRPPGTGCERGLAARDGFFEVQDLCLGRIPESNQGRHVVAESRRPHRGPDESERVHQSGAGREPESCGRL